MILCGILIQGRDSRKKVLAFEGRLSKVSMLSDSENPGEGIVSFSEIPEPVDL